MVGNNTEMLIIQKVDSLEKVTKCDDIHRYVTIYSANSEFVFRVILFCLR